MERDRRGRRQPAAGRVLGLRHDARGRADDRQRIQCPAASVRIPRRGRLSRGHGAELHGASAEPHPDPVRAAPERPWKYLGRLPLGNSGTVSNSCNGNALAYFQGQVAARLANAYYRANYPGDADFDHTVSKAAHAWLYTTRITSFTVTPPSVRAGQRVTMSGRLWRHARSWSGYGHRQVALLYRRKGAKTWYLISEVLTSASGSFSGTATASGRGTLIVMALYGGDKTHLWSQSSAVTVSITAIQSASLGPAAQLRSRAGRLAGTPGRLPSAYLTALLRQA